VRVGRAAAPALLITWLSTPESIGIASTLTLTASSTAEATTAGTGNVPDSPTPFRPSGFSGDGVSRWSISSGGKSSLRGSA
jgi:hypothetical protein